MNFLFNLLILWKSLPTVMRYFNMLDVETERVDDLGRPWNDSGGNAGEFPTFLATRPTSEDATIAGAGAAFAFYRILKA